MEVTQRLQSMQDKAYTLLEEIEGQGAHLEQVVTIVEKCLEGPITEIVIQEFVEQEALSKQQVLRTKYQYNIEKPQKKYSTP
jgi:hypothetical protein